MERNTRNKEKALEDFWTFLNLIDFRGGVKNFGKVHKELADFLCYDPNPRKLILMPRGHLKSTLCSVGRVLWLIYKNPNIRIVVGTATKPLAASLVREVKQYLEDAELQATVWNRRPHIDGALIPALDGRMVSKQKRNREDDLENFGEEFTEALDKKVVWKADALQVLRPTIMKEPTLVATSVGSPATGFHYDECILDDLVSFDNSDTPEKRERITNWVGDIESVIDPYNEVTGLGGGFTMLGTRYYHRDLYGIYTGEDLDDDEKEDLIDDGDEDDYVVFKRNIYINGVDDSDGYLWPERFDQKTVEKIKRRLLKLPNGRRRFASQYLNSIMTDEEQVLSTENIRYIHDSAVSRKDEFTFQIRTSPEKLPQIIKFWCVLDPAISQSRYADSTVIMVGGMDADHNLYIVDVCSGKFTPTETVDKLYKVLDTWSLRTVHIDNEKLGQALMHTIRQSFNKYYPITMNPYKPQGEKKTRITNFLEPLFSNSNIVMLASLAMNKKLHEEIEFFPRQGAHDDHLDAMAMLVHLCKPTKDNKPMANRKRVRRLGVNREYGGCSYR